jgi:hypothetical protein
MATTGAVKVEELVELGFASAAEKVQQSQSLVRKTAIAYEHFDYITPEDVENFKNKVQNDTMKDHDGYRIYNTLLFHDIKDYSEVPPSDVLEKLRAAKELKCFDYFEIAKMESVKEVKDPILFGRIQDCGDYFFIAQWDDDVTIEAIKAASEKK